MFYKLLLFGNDRVYCKSNFQFARKKEIEMVSKTNAKLVYHIFF